MIENQFVQYEGAVPLEVQQKTEYLLKIWRDISYRIDDGAQSEVVKLKEKILYKLNDLVSEIQTGPEPVSADLVVPMCPTPISIWPGTEEELKKEIEAQRKEEEKKQFVEFLLNVLAVAEHNKQNS